MKRKYQVHEQAEQDLLQIEDFLLKKWNYAVLFDFLEKFRKTIDILLNDKIVFQKYEDTRYHKFLLTNHNTIIYNYKDDELHIYRILQNFQNPEDNYESLTSE